MERDTEGWDIKKHSCCPDPDTDPDFDRSFVPGHRK
jgi:hypothetical protein